MSAQQIKMYQSDQKGIKAKRLSCTSDMMFKDNPGRSSVFLHFQQKFFD